MTEWFRDGRPCDSIAADDRGLQYGDGLFETVAVRAGEPRLWEYHVDRLQTGAERLTIAVPGRAALRAGLDAALERTRIDTDRCVAKILLTGGRGPRGYRRPEGTPPTLLTGVADAGSLPDACYRDGVETLLCNTRLALQPQLAGMKTLNRLEQVLARNEWRDERIVEGLTLDTAGRLICGTMSNVFLITGQELVTPAITRCGVSGVMRRHLLTLLDRAGVRFSVRDVPLQDLRACDGVCICNSQFGMLHVRRCGRQQWQPRDAFRRVAALLRASGVVEGPD